jgi:hypothetical protein
MGGDRLGPEDAIHQLIHDDAIDFPALLSVGAHIFQAARGELVRVDVTVNEPARPEQAQAVKPAPRRLGGHDLGDMEPGQR